MTLRKWFDTDDDIEKTRHRLSSLYARIQNCDKCQLFELEKNVMQKPPGKLGSRRILIVSQNPSWFRKKIAHVWGGLDKLNVDFLDKVFITNIVKCSFLNDKVPEDIDKITSTCFKWLNEEIRILRPEKIIVLGKIAKTSLKFLKHTLLDVKYLAHPQFAIRSGTKETYIKKLEEAIR